MYGMLPRVEGLLERFVSWAKTRDDVRGAVLIGSQARTDHPADAFSDVDILVVATEASLVDDRDWPGAMGEPRITFVEEAPLGGLRERRVLYADGLDVDYVVVPAFALGAVATVAADVLARGFRVLVDKDGQLASLSASVAPPPAESARVDGLGEGVSDFWYHAVWTSRKLARGEFLMAHACLADRLRPKLVAMLRVEAGDRDTWHGERFFEEWVEPSKLGAFADTFATFSCADLARALAATMDLYAQIVRELAPRIGFEYPEAEERFAREQVADALGIRADSTLVH